jgi:NAD(P)-dependent dehydrogenase (short-subunit alcohol dehydrogenase family)
MPIALITGASRGLGRAAAHALARRGWSLIVDARRADDLAGAMRGLADVVTVPGDVTDPGHRADLAAAVGRAGGLDVLVNNASRLGPSPQPLLRDYPLDELGRVYDTNVLAPLALIQLLTAPLAAAAGTIVNVSSDAAVEAYPGWGGYGRRRPLWTSSPPSWPPRSRRCAATRWTPVTCAQTCTSRRFPARTSPTGRSRKRWSRR